MTVPPLFDAHDHLHDARLAPWRTEILEGLPALGIRAAVVNGTSEADWPEVARLAKDTPWALPSFGLHPWHVNSRTPAWRENFIALLDAHPSAGIGEIGLDRWIEGHDPAAQSECFKWQLEVATKRNLPVTIHCLRAWGSLLDIIRASGTPACGFLLHAYSGPSEMVDEFLDRGAYFSFSPYFLHERKTARRDIFRKLRPDRLLVETDAPDLAPPVERNAHLLHSPDGKILNHTANLRVAYRALAEIRGMEYEALASLVAGNFGSFFRWHANSPPPSLALPSDRAPDTHFSGIQ